VDCIRVLNATEPRLLKYFKKEKGMHKADMCRVAELYLLGGYYFDVDLLAVHPVSPANSVQFVTVKAPDEAKDGFFQAFTASAPGHPILKKSLDILLEVYQGKRKREGWLGPKTMHIAYEL
jgi:mannosyltransferase OCH1-like enzyme